MYNNCVIGPWSWVTATCHNVVQTNASEQTDMAGQENVHGAEDILIYIFFLGSFFIFISDIVTISTIIFLFGKSEHIPKDSLVNGWINRMNVSLHIHIHIHHEYICLHLTKKKSASICPSACMYMYRPYLFCSLSLAKTTQLIHWNLQNLCHPTSLMIKVK